MLTLTAAALLAGVLYAGLCWVSPFGNCRRCKGFGYAVKAGRPRRGKPCRRCDATGLRLRIGRRIHNRARAVHDAGTTTRKGI